MTRDLWAIAATSRRFPNCGFLTPPKAGFGMTSGEGVIPSDPSFCHPERQRGISSSFATTSRRFPNCGFLTPPKAGFGMTSEGDQFAMKIDKYTRNM